ncbi:unnamed protein product [Sphenostylis stenocarpa]|uniref:Mitochondrial import inner membrane translocase subunit TIM50 n=1 Tax=Sphenostylis stenocarpa TaxID=92480 RepID=A0AA86SJ10_9FABA|nr:unnamed protein product [Sphenostylis stenocarpa]
MDPQGNSVKTELTVSEKGKNDKELSSHAEEKRTVSAPSRNEDLSAEIYNIFLGGTQVLPLKKRLIVLDINGLLAAVVSPPPKDRETDITIARRAIFKRPSYLEFLEFCFDKFEVGIWKNVDRIINYLLPFLKNKLLFGWEDLSHCTETRFKTLENKNKSLVFKDLRKLWDKEDPNLPWEKGYYNEFNTLLLDDSPYKALLNPVNNFTPFVFLITACHFVDDELTQLKIMTAEGGELRVYLDGLANAEDMHKYVEEHPFGQKGISETSESWNFYSLVIESLSTGESNALI